MFFNDEYMIIQNSNATIGGYGFKYYDLDTPQLKLIKDNCGINVVQESVFWHDIEKSQGNYNWSLPDLQIGRVLNAGMKAMVCVPISVPKFFHDDWYWAKRGNKVDKLGLSFWNPEAQEYQRNFIKIFIERYKSPNVNMIFHGFLGGESVMWNDPGFYDVYAITDFKNKHSGLPETREAPQKLIQPARDWLRDAVVQHHLFMQDAFVKQYNELWDALQPNIGLQSEANGNFAQYDIHKAYAETYPSATQYLLMYTYWSNGEWSANQINKIIKDFKCKVIVEANYCEGLAGTPSTTDLAIELGFHGQIVGPLHPFRGHKEIEPWMYEIMKVSNEKWKKANEK